MAKKRKKNPSLNHQLNLIMQHAFEKGKGTSKRAHRGQVDKMKNDRIFSYSNYNTILGTSRALVKFIKDNNIKVKKAEDINKDIITDFLKFKAQTNNDNSMKKILQNLSSLAIFISDYTHTNVDWNVPLPTSQKAYNKAQTKFGKAMPYEMFIHLVKYLRQDIEKGDLEMARLLVFCYRTGMRIDEIAFQKIEDIDLTGGDYGFGKINVSNPKHGRPRILSILSEAEQKELKILIQIAKEKGIDTITNIPRTTLTSRLSRAKKRANLQNANLIGWHGVRKLHAQKYYDFMRKKHTKSDTIGYTNLRLGHGFDRGVQGIKTYVGNIY